MTEHRPCPKCGELDSSKFYATGSWCKGCSNTQSNQWKKEHPEKRNAWHRAWRATEEGKAYYRNLTRDLRVACLKKLGQKCAWRDCDWVDPRALHIDHVNGGGCEEHRQLNGSRAFYKRVLADTEGKYQLLCANHNAIKKYTQLEGVSENHPLAEKARCGSVG